MGVLGRYDEHRDELVRPGVKAGRWRYDETSEEVDESKSDEESEGEESESLD